jgi:hypothetical protein
LDDWVANSLSGRARRDQQRQHMGAAIADYAAEFREITADEIAAKGPL